jgi:hypothetical protein
VASVVLNTVWLNDALNPSDYASFPLMAALNVTTSQSGEVRQYAGGRTRLVLKAGTPRNISLDLPELDRAQVAWLESHVGKLVLVRDDRGRKIWAAYITAGIDEAQGHKTASAGIGLTEVSYTEVL